MLGKPQNIFSVTDLTRKIKGTLEEGFSRIAVQGELSNFKHHSSGHLYFTLKDEHAQIQCVMWRSRVPALSVTPQDGMKMIARGNVTVYEVRGNYQLDVASLQLLGAGELQIAFERLKQKLAAEGLFDQDHKKPLPQFPQRIGIVTSPTGAAIQDIINIINRRFPSTELILCPVKVQGIGAAEEIASAIDDFNNFGAVDVILVGRGGGSLEDLWAFNEEIVARSIYHSSIPVVSAVGHEIDFTIADFVADLRAPTPSAAAELIVPDRREIIEIVRNFCYTSEQIVRTKLTNQKSTITALLQSYSFNRPLDRLHQYSQHLDEINRAFDQSVGHRFTLLGQILHSLEKRMLSLNPEIVLQRGYAILIRNGKAVSKSKHLHPEDEIDIKMTDGTVSAVVK